MPRQRRSRRPARAAGARLEVNSLRKAFGGLVAVDNLSFAVRRGEIVGLIGPNGSGKTTVLNLISGALPADAGTVSCDGHEHDGIAARIASPGSASPARSSSCACSKP